MSEPERYLFCEKIYSRIAQPVEQLTVNQWVVGSSPTVGAKIKGIPKGIPLIFFSHSRTERMIFHEVKGRCESVCTNVHTCRLRSRATQCRESSISARQRTCTNSIKADFCSLFCLFKFCVGLEPFEHRYARRTSSHFCLAAKPLYAVQSTALWEPKLKGYQRVSL